MATQNTTLTPDDLDISPAALEGLYRALVTAQQDSTREISEIVRDSVAAFLPQIQQSQDALVNVTENVLGAVQKSVAQARAEQAAALTQLADSLADLAGTEEIAALRENLERAERRANRWSAAAVSTSGVCLVLLLALLLG
jgi:hypothetical protein